MAATTTGPARLDREPDVLTKADVARILATSRWTVDRLIRDGHLRKIPHMGHHVRISRRELETFINSEEAS